MGRGKEGEGVGLLTREKAGCSPTLNREEKERDR